MATKLPLAGQAEIPLDRILVSGENPRTHFDEETLAELARSIEKDGLLQSILVRPVPSDEEWPTLQKAKREGRLPDGWEESPELEGSIYELVSGERRLRAHQELGEDRIRAEIRPMSRKTAVRIRLIENVQREDLDELEEARAYQRMLDELDYDVEAIAEEVGKSASYVYQRLKLQELAEPVQEALAGGDLTAGHAIEIARLPTPELQERALAATVGNRHMRGTGGGGTTTLSVRDLRKWIRVNANLDLHAAPWKKDDADLLPAAGPCTACPKRTGNAADLWPDVDEGATCTDPDCYQEKVEAFVERRAGSLEASEHEYHRVSVEHYSPKHVPGWKRAADVYTDDTLGKNDWTRLHDEDLCDAAVTGLVVDGAEIGELIDICPHSGCTVHGRGGQEDRQDAEARRIRQRNDRERGRRENEAARQIAASVLEADIKDSHRFGLAGVLQVAFVRLLEECHVHDAKKALAALQEHGYEVPGEPRDRIGIAAWAESAGGEALRHGLLTLALNKAFRGGTWEPWTPRFQLRGGIAELAGVDPEAIDETIREESSWTLPEDLIELEYVLGAEDVEAEEAEDGSPPLGATYHPREVGQAAPLCGGGPEETRIRDTEPSHWRWDLCGRCEAALVRLQTSAMEEADDG